MNDKDDDKNKLVSDESDNYLCCLVISLYLCFDIREKGPNAFQEFQSCLFSMPQ